MARHLMWFRSDLRTVDNTALAAACRAAVTGEPDSGVIAVFVICPQQWRAHDWACVKVEFILRTLRVLSNDLEKLNIPLLIRTTPTFEGVPQVLLDIARSHSCSALHYSKEYEVNELARDARVNTQLSSANFRVHAHTDQVLVEPGDVRTGEGRFFTVFSPFKRALYRHLERSPIAPVPSIRTPPPLPIQSSPVPDSVPGFSSAVPPELWPAGEHEASNRLTRFVERKIRVYKSERDFPALESTSALSPYLAIGAISPRACLRAALQANNHALDSGNDGIVHWISEVVWREFYKHILVGFPRVCKHLAFKPETDRLPWSDNDEHFKAWCEGRTGVPIVDAAMRALVATGWMHNRLRMVVAMYLTKDLFIDWRRGERFFMQNLVDGDLAPNNGGWQWSASTGTDAAPYFRIFNPVSQSRKFDPDAAFIRRWLPELNALSTGEDGDVHDPSQLPALLRRTVHYPSPIVDRARTIDRVKQAFASLNA